MMMKLSNLFKSIALLFIGVFLFSCSDDDSNDDNSNSNSQIINQVTANVQSGAWIITEFIDSGQDETNDFNGYVSTFSANGELTATSSANEMMGTWSVTDDDSSDDDSPSDSDVDFNIFFDVPESNNFEDLNDDWDIQSYTSTKIQLIDVSGGNGGTDYLTFEKN